MIDIRQTNFLYWQEKYRKTKGGDEGSVDPCPSLYLGINSLGSLLAAVTGELLGRGGKGREWGGKVRGSGGGKRRKIEKC